MRVYSLKMSLRVVLNLREVFWTTLIISKAKEKMSVTNNQTSENNKIITTIKHLNPTSHRKTNSSLWKKAKR